MSDSPVRKASLIQMWISTIAFAAAMLAHNPPFRGIPPRLMSPRQFARSRGFSNACHMERVAEEKRKLAAQQ